MQNVQLIPVANHDDLHTTVTQYASKGYLTQRDTGDSVTLSRKTPFNWPIAIICLFIPIVGWIALVAIIVASGRGNQVVTIRVDPDRALLPTPSRNDAVRAALSPTMAHNRY